MACSLNKIAKFHDIKEVKRYLFPESQQGWKENGTVKDTVTVCHILRSYIIYNLVLVSKYCQTSKSTSAHKKI